MTRFLVFHKLPDAMTQDELLAAGEAMNAAQPDEARWLRGWVSPENDRLVGEWEAAEGEAVRAALKEVDLFPVEAVHLVVAVDPVWFKEPDNPAG
jgi:hypothetical protein